MPVDVVLGAKEAGYKVVVIGVVPDTNVELPKVADNFFSVNIGKIGKIVKTLQENKVQEVTMIGKVTKEVLYSKGVMIPDWQAVKLLFSLKDRHDDTIMNALVAFVEKSGIKVMDQTIFLKALFPAPGVLARENPLLMN